MLELKLDRVSKQYKNKIAVDQAEALFTRGVYGLLGANGAGKTTLLRMIAGVLRPTQGEVLCNGREIRSMGGAYRQMLGYLPQDFGYYPEFTAERYLRYLAELKAVPPDTAEIKIGELLEQTGLWEDRKRKIKTFSGGMVRRLGIAQALLNEPEILVLDEPTSGLDPKERIRFRNLISSLGRNRIVILSSHIVSDIAFIAEEILLMKEGQLLIQAKPELILERMEGKVWEYMADSAEAAEVNDRYTVSNMKNAGEKVRLRIVSEECPVDGAVPAAPDMEDVYLYYFSGKGGKAGGEA